MKNKTLIDILEASLGTLWYPSPYGLTFMWRINKAVYTKLREAKEDDTRKILTCIPFSPPTRNHNFGFFPLDSEKYEEAIELGVVPGWDSGRSMLIIKMNEMADQIATYLYNIAAQDNMPFRSIYEMVNLMTHKFQDQEEENTWRSLCSQYQVMIPAKIQSNQRDNYLLKINKKIMDIFYEAFCVLFYLASIELLRYVQLFCDLKEGKSYDLEFLKKFLYEESCLQYFANRVSKIKNWDDLSGYIVPRYGFSIDFLDENKKYINACTATFVKRLIEIKESPIKCIEDIDEERKDLLSLTDKNMENGYDYKDKEQHGIHRDNQTLSINQTQYKEFHYEIIPRFVQRMDDWLFKRYELRGSPWFVIGYVKKIVRNVARDILIEEYDKKLKEKVGIGYQTLKRYGKKYVVAHEDQGSSKFQTANLSTERIEQIKRQKELNKKHQKEGYFTQN